MSTGPEREENSRLQRVRFALRSAGLKPWQTRTNPLRSGDHSRGYLPHVKREGASYFVTFRLADSLPREVLLKFEGERAKALRVTAARSGDVVPEAERVEIERELRRKVERYLDQGAGECHLHRPEVASLMTGALRHFDGERYVLRDWVVMPNHVHVVVWPMPNQLLSDILKSWKRFTSREANKLLGRTGETFWQPESFDHWVRDDAEMARICRYIRNNPVSARLCPAPERWQWSSAWPGWKQDAGDQTTGAKP